MHLDKILDILASIVPSCNVVRTRAPSYIKVHTGVDEEIILITSKIKTSTTSSCISNADDRKEELELTGSPLKLDMSLRNILEDTMPLDETQHWYRDEVSHAPTTFNVARTVCNEYIKMTKDTEASEAMPLWVVTNAADEKRTLLLCTRSYKNHFVRGIVTYEGEIALDAMSFEKLSDPDVQIKVECKLRIAGVSYARHPSEDVQSAPHTGITQLLCQWNEQTLEVPLHCATVKLEQEVIVGHEMSPCRVLWTSIYAVNSINRALVDMAATGYAAIDLRHVSIRPTSKSAGPTLQENTRRVQGLLSEVEAYSFASRVLRGGCVGVPGDAGDAGSLRRCLEEMRRAGSSNDFTYQLWDILKDSETAEDIISLLIHALKSVASGKMKPFITPSNKTFLAKLVLKLSRGHSQTSAVLKNLRASPQQALALLGQLGLEKTTWEMTHLFTLVDHSFGVDNVLMAHRRSDESIEVINQTIHDMTMGCGDVTLNPFENKSLTENSIRLNSESFLDEEPRELSVDNFASLRKHGLVGEKGAVNEVPLILDEVDVSGWKTVLCRCAQLYVCLEHLNRMQQCLRLDMASLTSYAASLQAFYLSDKSPVRTVAQLSSEPVQAYAATVSAALLREHLNNKLASFYLVHIYRKRDSDSPLSQLNRVTHVFTQSPLFPPAVWRFNEMEDDVNDATVSSGLKYHHTQYVYLSNEVVTRRQCGDNGV